MSGAVHYSIQYINGESKTLGLARSPPLYLYSKCGRVYSYVERQEMIVRTTRNHYDTQALHFERSQEQRFKRINGVTQHVLK